MHPHFNSLLDYNGPYNLIIPFTIKQENATIIYSDSTNNEVKVDMVKTKNGLSTINNRPND